MTFVTSHDRSNKDHPRHKRISDKAWFFTIKYVVRKLSYWAPFHKAIKQALQLKKKKLQKINLPAVIFWWRTRRMLALWILMEVQRKTAPSGHCKVVTDVSRFQKMIVHCS